jgi:hypothetical protein
MVFSMVMVSNSTWYMDTGTDRLGDLIRRFGRFLGTDSTWYASTHVTL